MQVSTGLRREEAGGKLPPTSRLYPTPGQSHSMVFLGQLPKPIVTVASQKKKRYAQQYQQERAAPERVQQRAAVIELGSDDSDVEVAAAQQAMKEAFAAAERAKANKAARRCARTLEQAGTLGEALEENGAEAGGPAEVLPVRTRAARAPDGEVLRF